MAARIERRAVQAMFGDIAPTYDLLNRLLSLGIDQGWRRAGVRLLLLDALRGEGRFLDLATGTADVALEIRRQLGPRARVAGADFAFPMLLRAREKAARRRAGLDLLQADALALPFPSGAFDGVIIAFGLRNLEDRAAGLAEMARVLRPGGRLVILEFGKPAGLFGMVFRFYFRWLLPAVGRLVSGHPTAYRYLPETVGEFPPAGALSAMMREAGLGHVAVRPLTGGIVELHTGVRLERAAG
ncbi:MAG: ubiquinone/menaquinone biosynthesis methyltransferase [Nitrospinota bacterium]